MEFAIVAAMIVGLLLLPRLRKMLLSQVDTTPPGTAQQAVVLARVRQLKYFYIHAGLYIITMLGVFALALLVGAASTAIIGGVGWGLILALHAFWVFGINGVMLEWEQRRVDAMLNDQQKADQKPPTTIDVTPHDEQ